MAAIDDLLARVADGPLRDALAKEVRVLRERREYGLVFERHLPERVRLYSHPVRDGLMVQRRSEPSSEPPWLVTDVDGSSASMFRVEDGGQVEVVVPVGDVVVVRDFGDPIFPGLKSVDRIELGGDRPFHAVISGENSHALRALLYSHESSVDCIYIDPPYNKGKLGEWKYGDRWVDSNDDYRHSKWLAFMERRLLLAKRLLTEDGILLVSIDDDELSQLRMLLDQPHVFGHQNWVATFVWRSDGNMDNQAQVKTNHEYIVMFAKNKEKMAVAPVIDTNVDEASKLFTEEIRNSVVKNGAKNPKSTIVLPAGFPAGFESGTVPARTDKWPHYDTDVVVAGNALVNPVNAYTGWSSATMLKKFIAGGYVPVIDSKGQPTVFEVTATGAIEGVKVRSDEQSHILTVLMNMGTTEKASGALARMGTDFTYPKPVPLVKYLVSLCRNKSGTFLDFFAGSGTTFEAVAELNAEDGGTRRCLLVTNNEVDHATAETLLAAGVHPGDAAWEECGIFNQVTRPRVSAVTTGKAVNGTVLSAGYEENVDFFELTYEDRDVVWVGHAFEAIAPLLWLRAGGQGPRIDEIPEEPYAVPEGGRYGVLFDADHWRPFVDQIKATSTVGVAYVVTDSTAVFQTVASELPDGVEPLRLYSNYLLSFDTTTGGEL